MEHINESVIVAVDLHSEYEGVLIVGRQDEGKMKILNAIQGKEAWDLYHKIITGKEKSND